MSKEPNRNVYVGHRYVPKIMGEWDQSIDYEGLSIVTHQGASYTSKKRVPVGIDILNNEFWVATGNYNAQVEYYRDETERVSNDLLLKADLSYVNTELDKKSDISYVNTELDKKVNKDHVVVSVDDYGAVGDGVHDDGDAIRQAVQFLEDNKGGVLFFTPGKQYLADLEEYRPGRYAIAHIKNNVHVDLLGANLKTINSANRRNTDILAFYDSENCSIYGGSLTGDKYNSGNTGEWGMGIGLYGALNFKAENIFIEECYGDGVYIGRSDNKTHCENVTLNNIICDNNRRQGISLVSCKNLKGTNIICKNTEGTAPADGIDIEPNNPDECLVNILFENIFTSNNAGSGIKLYLSNFDDRTETVSVKIINHKDDSTVGNSPFRIRRIRKDTKGIIEIINPVWKSNYSTIFSHEECSSSGIKVYLENPNIYYYGQNVTVAPVSLMGGRGNALPDFPDDVINSTVGNIEIKNIVIESVDNIKAPHGIRVAGYSGHSYDKLKIENPVKIDSLSNEAYGTQAISFFSDATNVNIKDENNLLFNSGALGTMVTSRTRLMKTIVNETIEGRGAISLGGYSNIVGHIVEVKIYSKNAIIRPGDENKFLGFDVGQGIEIISENGYINAQVKVVENGVFEVLNNNGNWKAETI